MATYDVKVSLDSTHRALGLDDMDTVEISVPMEGRHPSTVEKTARRALKLDKHATLSVKKREAGGKSRSERLADAEALFSDAKSEVESLKEELESRKENLPESLQNWSKGQELDDAIQALEEIENEMGGIDFQGVNFPGMY